MNEQYLLNNGWTKLSHTWQDGKTTYSYDKDGQFSRGGLSLDYAIKVQKQHEIIDKYGVCYLAIRDNLGYGWKLRKFTDKKKENWQSTNFTHLTEEDAKKCEKLFNDGVDVAVVDAPRQTFNQVVKFKEKHSDRYFYVPTFEDLCKVAIKIFKERVDEGYWYDFDDLEEPEKPDISKEKIAELKNTRLKTAAEQAWVRYENELKYRAESLREKQFYEKALKDKTGAIVLQFLTDRKDSEYESWEMIDLEEY